MNNFTDDLVTKYIGGSGYREIVKPFIFWTEWMDNHGSGVPIYCMDKLVIDFASIPWPFKMIWPKDGDYNQATVPHDLLYKTKGFVFDPRKEIRVETFRKNKIFGGVRFKQVIQGFPIYRFTRKETDFVFRNAMEIIDKHTDYNIPGYQREIMFRAVRTNFPAGWKLTKEDYILRDQFDDKAFMEFFKEPPAS
ncbi:MAG: DUF1353 domain-containing protein [Candidatus Omnitrophica bacterium]|nr:DUF1353 domain-containing protein [Candidatus Omnitrophota bacterium]